MKTEVAFQRLDPLGERRLGEVEVLGGMSEMAEVGDFHESPELPEFHSRLDYGPTRALGSTHERRRSATRPLICYMWKGTGHAARSLSWLPDANQLALSANSFVYVS